MMKRGSVSTPKSERRDHGHAALRVRSLEAYAALLSRMVANGSPWPRLVEGEPSLLPLFPGCEGACAVSDTPTVRATGSTPGREQILSLIEWARLGSADMVVAATLSSMASNGTPRSALVAFVDHRRRAALLFFRKLTPTTARARGGGAIVAAGRKSWAGWERDLAERLAQAVGQAVAREGRRSAVAGSLELRALDNQARIRAILSVLQDGILLVNEAGQIEYANQQLCTQMSIDEPPEALIGWTAAQVKDAIMRTFRDPAGAIKRIEELVKRGEPYLGEEVALANGRTLLRDFIPFPFGAGRVGRLWHQRDVTSMREAQRKLADANKKLEELSLTDGLTGLANRRQFDQTLAREWSRSMRLGRPLAVIMMDIDLFKKFNDHYGHQGGDDCLRMIADAIRAGARRASDLAARYGGEEFAIIAVDTDLTNAWTLAEVVRLSIRDRALAHALSPAGIVTASCGVAAMVPGEGIRAEALLRLADQALYRAKAAGGDRIEVTRGDEGAGTKEKEAKKDE